MAMMFMMLEFEKRVGVAEKYWEIMVAVTWRKESSVAVVVAK